MVTTGSRPYRIRRTGRLAAPSPGRAENEPREFHLHLPTCRCPPCSRPAAFEAAWLRRDSARREYGYGLLNAPAVTRAATSERSLVVAHQREELVPTLYGLDPRGDVDRSREIADRLG